MENFTIDFEKLNDSFDLTFIDFIILNIIYKKRFDILSLINVSNRYIKYQELGYIKITGLGVEDIEPRQKLIDIFEKKVDKVENWIQDYRNLFKGKKNQSMGDPNACLKLMKKFVKEHPEYTKNDIFNATKNYISEQAPNYTYLQRADYFIMKYDLNKIPSSRLLMYCESLNNEAHGKGILTTYEEIL